MTQTLIIGAGITGAALAFQLFRRGEDVTLVSTHAQGGLASAASFGWLNASYFLNHSHYHLRHAGMAAHRRLTEALPGLPTTWQGCLWYEATGDAQEETAADLLALGYKVERLIRSQIVDRLPALGPVPDTALFFPEEGVADPAILARALITASGAAVVRATVQSVTEKKGRATGVLTDLGPLPADRVILATGTGTPELLEPLGFTLPMLQRPGLMIATNALPPICPVVLATPDQEVRQDAKGHLIAPASAGHQGDHAETLGSFPVVVNATLTRLRALFPGHDIHFAHQAMALRPVPGDGLPVVGQGPLKGLWIAVMHSGATLAPVAAELLAEEITGGPESPLLADFRPARFQ
ncbi:FAD-binding oxidoreductase [Tabrizicola sp.]|uniref:NAD(P)/FAD-dependent oxidoreductase n=1 Tax=Tabrizicola sp. TaxID=2005166 RepID=UPI001A61A653|nr:FAD-binding oxidoreductase [Tabrizicola sp.]MBL9075219.1 FAD-binding oxidoreductase [Tabrizicola sp.]